MCPVLDWVVPDNFTSCVQKDLKMWFYTSCQPYLPWPNVRLDNPLLDARLLFWYAKSLRADGYLYWGFNVWPASMAKHPPILPPSDSEELFLQVTLASDPSPNPNLYCSLVTGTNPNLYCSLVTGTWPRVIFAVPT